MWGRTAQHKEGKATEAACVHNETQFSHICLAKWFSRVDLGKDAVRP
jgi:hypothetical protein